MYSNSFISVALLAITPLVALPLWFFVQNKDNKWFRSISLVSIGSIWAAVLLHYFHTESHEATDLDHYHFNGWGLFFGVLFSISLHFLNRGKNKLDSLTIVTADYIHNIVNSFTLLVSVIALPEMWLPITFSLILHELVHKASNYGLFISIGVTPTKALIYILGGIPMFLILPLLKSFVPLDGSIIPFLSNFASANLIVTSFFALNAIHKKQKINASEWILILAGTIPAVFINFVAHAH